MMPLNQTATETPPALDLTQLNACIHCGMCLSACPTYRVTGSEAESPRGRLYLMRQWLEGRLRHSRQVTKHLDPCLGCLACVTACPSGVAYGDLLGAARASLVTEQPWWKRAFRRFCFRQILPHPRRLAVLVQIVWLYQVSGLRALVQTLQLWRLLGPLGFTERFLPTIRPASPVVEGTVYPADSAVRFRGRVALFTGCLMNAVYAAIHHDTVTVLTANGYEVFVPPQTCCGALAHHSGETDIAQALAQENVARMLPDPPDGMLPDWIVVNAAGCGATLKDYRHLLSTHPHAARFTDKVIDVLALLAQEPLTPPKHAVPLTVTYHAACHLHHAQGVQQEPYTLLAQIPGLTVMPLTDADQCCGSAGIYNLAHPQLSGAILAEKTARLAQTGTDSVLAANPGCLLQLEAGLREARLPMTVQHPISLLAQAYSDRQA